MSSVVISGDSSGTVTVAAPAVAGTNTLTLQAATATNAVNKLETAVASTSGTSIDYTSIPSWCKRITVMFSGVSTNGSSHFLVQIGAGSVTSSGYVSAATASFSGSPYNAIASSTAGYIVYSGAATTVISGLITLATIGSNTWVESHAGSTTAGGVFSSQGGGTLALGGTLDRVRITTVNGTDTFDAGSVNLLLEG
jgi:hypothetical protein